MINTRSHWPASVFVSVLTLAAGLPMTGCGGSSHPGQGHPAAGRPAVSAAGSFGWLRPASVPAGWHTASIQGGHATMSYPPGWQRIIGDTGTATVALRKGNAFDGYINVTPRQGAETPAGWAAFRLDRLREEHDRQVREVAAATGLQFRGGRGSCLIDDYNAHVGGQRYREIGCFVVGPRASTVIIATTRLATWSAQGPTLERAVSAFTEN